jgi:aminoglycoside phosphotransferase (APT) family kinase protein
VNLEKLCLTLQLGDLISSPEVLTGGLLHKTYAIETTQGKYAIKALNPQIMSRTTALQNYINSEKIANIAANNLPALPAKQFNETSLQHLDGQYYLVFAWVDGSSLKANEINLVHCEKMGAILADIHMMDFSDLNISKDNTDATKLTEWNDYLQHGQMNHANWVNLMQETIDLLHDWTRRSNNAAQQLASNTVISHLDLDSKNVLWNRFVPVLIDWEASGHINPMQSLTETAIYWSENESGLLDHDRFSAFIRGYKSRFGPIQTDWRIVLENGFLGMLGWLEYNLKRSLWIECADEQEQQLGTEQVIETINALKRYAARMPEIERWLDDESG